jgi:hypothetical protein
LSDDTSRDLDQEQVETVISTSDRSRSRITSASLARADVSGIPMMGEKKSDFLLAGMRHDDRSLHLSPANRSKLIAIRTDRNSSSKAVWRADIVLATADRLGTNARWRRPSASVSETATKR